MNDINFEKDQEEVLDRTENIKSLANQVKKLNLKYKKFQETSYLL